MMSLKDVTFRSGSENLSEWAILCSRWPQKHSINIYLLNAWAIHGDEQLATSLPFEISAGYDKKAIEGSQCEISLTLLWIWFFNSGG